MSGFIPMVSSSPPPMDDGGGFDWDDDDDEFGNFTGPDDSFPCQSDTKNNNRNEVNDPENAGSGTCVEPPNFHKTYFDTNTEDPNAINCIKDQRPNSIEFIRNSDQAVDSNTGSQFENCGENAGTLSDSGLFSSEVSPVPQSGDNVGNGKSQSEYDSQEDLSAHSSPEKSCDKKQLQESRVVLEKISNEKTEIIDSSENRGMEPGTEFGVRTKDTVSQNIDEDSVCNSESQDKDVNSTCCNASDSLSHESFTSVVKDSSEQLTEVASDICEQTDETCDTSPSTTENKISDFKNVPNETNDNSGNFVTSIDIIESSENNADIENENDYDPVVSLTEKYEESKTNITTQLSGDSFVQSSQVIESSSHSDSEEQQTVEHESEKASANSEHGNNSNNDLCHKEQENTEEERGDIKMASLCQSDVDNSQEIKLNKSNDASEKDNSGEPLQTSNVEFNDESNIEDHFGDFNDVNDDFGDFSAASNETANALDEFEQRNDAQTSSKNEVSEDDVNGTGGNENELSNSEIYLSEVENKESSPSDFEEKNKDADDSEFGNFSASGTLNIENSNNSDDFGNFHENSKDEVEDLEYRNFSAPSADISKPKEPDDFGDFEENNKDDGIDSEFGNFSATGDDFSKFENSENADDFGNFDECNDGFAEFGTASEGSTAKDDGGWAAFSEAETGPATSGNNDDDDDDRWADFGKETVQPQEEPVAQENSSIAAQKNIQHMSKGEKLTYAVTMCFPASGIDDGSDIHLDDMGQILSVAGETKSAEEGLQDTWWQVRNLQSTNALAYQWTKSQWNNQLFATLHVDTQNILIGHKKAQVPIFASGLTLLEPTKGPSSSKPDILVDTTKTDTFSSSQSQMGYDRTKGSIKNESIPPAHFDWSGSGLTNPLEANNKTLNLDFLIQDQAVKSTVLESELMDMTLQPTKLGPIQPLENILANMKSSSTFRPASHTDNVSTESLRVIKSLPDLAFMTSKVLMFPIRMDE